MHSRTIRKAKEQVSVKTASATRTPLNLTVHSRGFSVPAKFRLWLDRTIFFGLLTVVALTAVPYGTVDPWWESVFESAVFVLTILWLIEGSLRGEWWTSEHRLMLPLFGVVVFAVIQCLPFSTLVATEAMGGLRVNAAISADPFETWRFAYKFLAITLIFGLVLRYASTEQRVRSLVYLIIAVSLASAIFGLIKSRLPEQILGERLSSSTGYAQFDNRNHFALLAEMGIGILLGLSTFERRELLRLVIYVLVAAILWAALLLTHSRGAVISLMVEIPVFFLLVISASQKSQESGGSRQRVTEFSKFHGKRLVATLTLAGLLFGLVGASVVLIGGDETVSRLERTRTEFSAGTAGPPKILRPQIWQATLKLIKDNPLVGVGFAGYSMAIPRYLNSSGELALEQAHNDYLELLASGGVIGAVISVWFLVWFGKMARQRLRLSRPFYRAIRCGALASAIAVAVHSLVDFGLHITINAVICSVLLAIIVRACEGTGIGNQTRIFRAA